MVELVQSYRELCNSIDRVAGRPFVSSIDVQADDYPVRSSVGSTRMHVSVSVFTDAFVLYVWISSLEVSCASVSCSPPHLV